ncbi:MAG: hypothetical protein QW540_10815 [Archaeoglobaceae archaeon]
MTNKIKISGNRVEIPEDLMGSSIRNAVEYLEKSYACTVPHLFTIFIDREMLRRGGTKIVMLDEIIHIAMGGTLGFEIIYYNDLGNYYFEQMRREKINNIDKILYYTKEYKNRMRPLKFLQHKLLREILEKGELKNLTEEDKYVKNEYLKALKREYLEECVKVLEELKKSFPDSILSLDDILSLNRDHACSLLSDDTTEFFKNICKENFQKINYITLRMGNKESWIHLLRTPILVLCKSSETTFEILECKELGSIDKSKIIDYFELTLEKEIFVEKMLKYG